VTEVVVGVLAARDIRDAVEYYEAAEGGLGDEFLDALEQLIARLTVFPRSAQPVAGYEHVRRALVARFPYAVFYRHADDRIDLLRVLHTTRSTSADP
jgi:plasmid stabilization system protein ParE